MHVRVYVCVSMCMRMCMCIYIYVHVSRHVHVSMCMRGYRRVGRRGPDPPPGQARWPVDLRTGRYGYATKMASALQL